VTRNYTSPKRLRGEVVWHLAYFPMPRKLCEDPHCNGTSDTGAAVLLEYKELIHPVAGTANLYCTINKRKSGVVTVNNGNERMAVGFLPVPIKRVSVLAASVKLLVPDVREIVLIELEHSVDRKPIIGTGATNFKMVYGHFVRSAS